MTNDVTYFVYYLKREPSLIRYIFLPPFYEDFSSIYQFKAFQV